MALFIFIAIAYWICMLSNSVVEELKGRSLVKSLKKNTELSIASLQSLKSETGNRKLGAFLELLTRERRFNSSIMSPGYSSIFNSVVVC